MDKKEDSGLPADETQGDIPEIASVPSLDVEEKKTKKRLIVVLAVILIFFVWAVGTFVYKQIIVRNDNFLETQPSSVVSSKDRVNQGQVGFIRGNEVWQINTITNEEERLLEIYASEVKTYGFPHLTWLSIDRLAVFYDQSFDSQTDEEVVVVFNLTDGTSHEVYRQNCGSFTYDLSPASNKLFYTCGCSVWAVGLSSGSEDEVLLTPKDRRVKEIKESRETCFEKVQASPDGDLLLVDVSHSFYPPDQEYWVLTADGERVWKVDIPYWSEKTWSPDGSKIIFENKGELKSQLTEEIMPASFWMINADGSDLKKLPFGEELLAQYDYRFFDLDYVAGGKKVLAEYRTEKKAIVLDFDKMEAEEFSHSGNFVCGWNQEASIILVCDYELTNQNDSFINVYNVAEGEENRLVNDALFPAWRP